MKQFLTRIEHDRLERALDEVPFHLMDTFKLTVDMQLTVKYIRNREEDIHDPDRE